MLFDAKPRADLQYSWVWGHSSAHAPCRESAPRSRPQPAAPRCCSRLSSRASSSAPSRTVCAPRGPELRGGLRFQNRQLQKKQSAKKRENEFVGFQHVCFFFVLNLLCSRLFPLNDRHNRISTGISAPLLKAWRSKTGLEGKNKVCYSIKMWLLN